MKKPRTSALRIRVTAAERAAIEQAGYTIGLGPSSFTRMAAVKAAGLKAAPPPRGLPDRHAVALARWTGEMSRIGSNVNQLARAQNSGLRIDSAKLDALCSELRALRDAVLKFHAELPPDAK